MYFIFVTCRITLPFLYVIGAQKQQKYTEKVFDFTETPECGDPEKPIYGVVKVHGEAAHYSCIPGYIRRGNSSRICTWSGWRPINVPECIGKCIKRIAF